MHESVDSIIKHNNDDHQCESRALFRVYEAIIDVTSRVLREAAEKVKRGAEPDPAKRVAEQIRDDVRKATSCESEFSSLILLSSLMTDVHNSRPF